MGAICGRTVAAVAFAWKAAAPYRRRLVAAVGCRVAALRAASVDVTVIGCDGVVPAELLAGCRLARGKDGAEVMRGIVAVLARRGVGPGLLLLVGSEFGGPGGEPGPDALLLVPEAARVIAVSVGPEPGGVPAGVIHAGGGCRVLLALLDEQVRRHARQRVPAVDEDRAWILCETGAGPERRRATESLFTLGAGGVATRGSVEEAAAGAQPMVLAAGVYDGIGPGQHLLPGPVWTGLAVEPAPAGDRRVLDLRTGVLERTELTASACPLRTVRLASITMPGVVAMRAEAPAGCPAGPPAAPPPGCRDDRRPPGRRVLGADRRQHRGRHHRRRRPANPPRRPRPHRAAGSRLRRQPASPARSADGGGCARGRGQGGFRPAARRSPRGLGAPVGRRRRPGPRRPPGAARVAVRVVPAVVRDQGAR